MYIYNSVVSCTCTLEPFYNGHHWDQLIVLLLEVSFVEGSFNIIMCQNGTRKVSVSFIGGSTVHVCTQTHLFYYNLPCVFLTTFGIFTISISGGHPLSVFVRVRLYNGRYNVHVHAYTLYMYTCS